MTARKCANCPVREAQATFSRRSKVADSDETARGDQSGSGNNDGKTLRKGHPDSGLCALAKDGCRRNRSRAFESLSKKRLLRWESRQATLAPCPKEFFRNKFMSCAVAHCSSDSLVARSVNGGNSISFRSTRTACFAGRMPRPRSWA
jgi:hypothetical protein